MGCFSYFKKRYISIRSGVSPPIQGTTPISSQMSISKDGTGMSEDSAAVEQMSKSTFSASSQKSIPELYEERGAHNLRVFELKELRNATNDFSRLLKIGEGGFGSVYKGYVKPPNGKGDRTIVAIKKLNPQGMQGHKQWLTEVQFLGIVEHTNLVKLIGYCSVDGERGAQRMLVYEFLPNKTLDDHLFNRAYPSLPWAIRLQIALGAAEGLAYLHERMEIQVIYRDFKASNVLLDEEFRPKLSDFGLAREGPSDNRTHVTTAVMGTHGYAAPDYVETGHLTTKSDVWSFGVVLYEILTGRRAMERNRPRNQQKLLDWVKQFPSQSGKFSMMIDPRLENKYSLLAAREVAVLADLCLSKFARERPKMSEVVESLKQAMQYKDLDGQVGAVEVTPSVDLNDNTEQESGVASARRRMLHLENLGKNIGGRKFVLMKARNQT
ncbi:probable serine/threonine-protein kinase PBL19 isoform X1 [Zingiber officinale]|uniref:probable serine/threonine-protein kinase PBL19 isoform X1 n=1 Tax=Zingiber officinale TaxID=94328 RepID=UPI001C4DC444|nr:probable serine/threonine-protein kinase PBL19 isoform X1 [Zingiber officinale]XP_042454073.1 probable serine/threonine-protein kinase PBL19 isoform X1 [Zingiber officinale]